MGSSPAKCWIINTMPDIHFECPKCGQTLDAPEELATQFIDCPTCEESIQIPARSQRKESPKPQDSTPKPVTKTSTPSLQAPTILDNLPPVKSSEVASALTFFAVLELIGAVIGGFAIGTGGGFNDAEHGWLIFIGGVLSGLILLGFARVVDYSFQSAQRLERIDITVERLKEVAKYEIEIKKLQNDISKQKQ
jgi:hypothetical protein